MNDLLGQLFDLDRKQRAIACATVVLLVFTGYWYFVYSGRRTEMTATLATIENLREQHDDKKKLIANLDTQRETVRELTATLRLAEAQLPDKKEIPDLLSSVSSAGRQSGLDVLLFRQKEERYQDFYAEVPVEVLVRGNYHQVATFFDRVGQLDRIVNVSNISMKGPRQDGESMIVETSCSAVTFRFLDEAERARVAQEKAEREKKGGKKG